MTRPRGRTPIKDQQFEAVLFQRRAVLSFLVILVVIGIVLARFADLMIVHHSEYAARSERNRVKLQPLPPARGLILDRKGKILADNRLAYRLELVPERVADMGRTLDELALVINFDEEERERFLALVAARRRFQSLPLRLRLSEDEVARFALERYRFPGVDVVPYLTRFYPQGELFAHVVGYVGRIDPSDLGELDAERYAGTTHVGKTGIERYYESQLHGEVEVGGGAGRADPRCLAEGLGPGDRLDSSIPRQLLGDHAPVLVVEAVDDLVVVCDPHRHDGRSVQGDRDARALEIPGQHFGLGEHDRRGGGVEQASDEVALAGSVVGHGRGSSAS